MDEQASPAPRKRAWFQLHLSTCVVLMLAAGVLMWANIQFIVDLDYGERGWPWPYYREVYTIQYIGRSRPLPEFDKWPEPYYMIDSLVMDIGVGIAILAVIAAFCEWLIRRRRKSVASA